MRRTLFPLTLGMLLALRTQAVDGQSTQDWFRMVDTGSRQFYLNRPAGTQSPIVVNPKDRQKYVWIAPGTFRMGCSAGDAECDDNEKPSHSVTISKGFWIGQTLVTQMAYRRVMKANPSHFRGPLLPVESVTWNQAKAYCQAVGGRLPTEAEWEYSARAGSAQARYGDLDGIAWYDRNSGNTTHMVRQKQPNAWGLYDVLGNVLEWTGDWYDADYYKKSPATDPPGPPSGPAIVLRGGSWRHWSEYLRFSERRLQTLPTTRDKDIGFRCVREVFP